MNESKIRAAIAVHLKQYMDREKLRQFEMAGRLGITRSSLADIISRRKNMHVTLLHKTSCLLGVTVEELCGLSPQS